MTQIIWPEPSLVSTITHLKAHRSTKAMHPSTPRPSVEQGELMYTRTPTHAQARWSFNYINSSSDEDDVYINAPSYAYIDFTLGVDTGYRGTTSQSSSTLRLARMSSTSAPPNFDMMILPSSLTYYLARMLTASAHCHPSTPTVWIEWRSSP
ncbi:hypothetical protein TRIUR3_32287 [Triticum urartu]|uniref:Uncharacterized protein n=1 Tax=Triticum urartu TaxID=4572 RepID=M8A5E7_TRIUA|nr:hypothetical protein TRIUR3_32287 [Triticum urartu]